MQTGKYITVEEILFKASGFAGDPENKVIPKGFYIQLISDAFEELNGQTNFIKGHADFDMPDNLCIPLPSDCFNVTGVWVYTGSECNFSQARKIWWKRNYYTRGGTGYIANRTGNGIPDPFYAPIGDAQPEFPGKPYIHTNPPSTINNTLFYNLQNGNLMVSSSCKAAGNKIHIEYSSTGCDVVSAPIIPIFYRTAIEDYTTEAVLRFRAANDPANAKLWMGLQQEYKNRLDKEGFYGSWNKAVSYAKRMSQSQREELAVYLERGAWATGR